ncbi:hypothetical protein LXL04_009266 [Taraxacum kok-saghyz]
MRRSGSSGVPGSTPFGLRHYTNVYVGQASVDESRFKALQGHDTLVQGLIMHNREKGGLNTYREEQKDSDDRRQERKITESSSEGRGRCRSGAGREEEQSKVCSGLNQSKLRAYQQQRNVPERKIERGRGKCDAGTATWGRRKLPAEPRPSLKGAGVTGGSWGAYKKNFSSKTIECKANPSRQSDVKQLTLSRFSLSGAGNLSGEASPVVASFLSDSVRRFPAYSVAVFLSDSHFPAYSVASFLSDSHFPAYSVAVFLSDFLWRVSSLSPSDSRCLPLDSGYCRRFPILAGVFCLPQMLDDGSEGGVVSGRVKSPMVDGGCRSWVPELDVGGVLRSNLSVPLSFGCLVYYEELNRRNLTFFGKPNWLIILMSRVR